MTSIYFFTFSAALSNLTNQYVLGYQKKRRKYQCDICGREFLHQGRCELHKKMHDVNYSCAEKDCNFKSDKRSILEEHQTATGHKELLASENVDQIVNEIISFDILKE